MSISDVTVLDALHKSAARSGLLVSRKNKYILTTEAAFIHYAERKFSVAIVNEVPSLTQVVI